MYNKVTNEDVLKLKAISGVEVLTGDEINSD